MKKENLIFVLTALIVGMLGGYLIFSIGSTKHESPAGGGVPMGSGSPTDYQNRIAEEEKIVASDPKNLQALIMLGNDYFDTGQPEKAISAYTRALALKPDDPNVLTDQGVMYLQTGANEKALADFEKAQQIDPKHLPSLYNIGVVNNNMKQFDKAVKAWSHYLELDSSSPKAQEVKARLEQLKSKSQPASFK